MEVIGRHIMFDSNGIRGMCMHSDLRYDVTGLKKIGMVSALISLIVVCASCGDDSSPVLGPSSEEPTPFVLSFQDPVEYEAGYDWLGSIVASDLDGDNDDDLVITSGLNYCFVVMKNEGDGTFQQKYARQLQTYIVRRLFAADLDGDGDEDLVTAHYDGTIHLHMNNGDATFQDPVFIEEPLLMVNTSNSADLLFVDDVNSDGYADIVASCYQPIGIAVLLNNGDATFRPPLFSAQKRETSHDKSILIDFDMDGELDILTTSYAASLVVITGIGDGIFMEGVIHEFLYWDVMGFVLTFAAPSDLDGDGDVDIVAGLRADVPLLQSIINTGNETLVRASTCETVRMYRYGTVGDMDGDGDVDLVATSYEDGFIMISQNDGNAVFDNSLFIETGTAANFSYAMSDLDGDGDLDLAVVKFDRVVIILNETGEQ
jgi:hypothetical protein